MERTAEKTVRNTDKPEAMGESRGAREGSRGEKRRGTRHPASSRAGASWTAIFLLVFLSLGVLACLGGHEFLGFLFFLYAGIGPIVHIHAAGKVEGRRE